MNVIISHDVDHLSVWEHKRDLILPKFILRNSIELILGKLSLIEYISRYKGFLENRWQNLEEMMCFDKENNIPSTFFFGVANGMGLTYALKDAEIWIKRILHEGFEVGVHGIAYDNHNDIRKEFETFKAITGLNTFGIRMHYLRQDENTLRFLNEAGYLYDSSVMKAMHPFKVGKLWEFPLHIMDGHIICNGARWQSQNLNQAKELTKRLIGEAYSKEVKYFTILFHDLYFSNGYKTWKEWYIWLTRYLRENGIDSIGYTQAVHELKKLQ